MGLGRKCVSAKKKNYSRFRLLALPVAVPPAHASFVTIRDSSLALATALDSDLGKQDSNAMSYIHGYQE